MLYFVTQTAQNGPESLQTEPVRAESAYGAASAASGNKVLKVVQPQKPHDLCVSWIEDGRILTWCYRKH